MEKSWNSKLVALSYMIIFHVPIPTIQATLMVNEHNLKLKIYFKYLFVGFAFMNSLKKISIGENPLKCTT
jgi:hypothetical protein